MHLLPPSPLVSNVVLMSTKPLPPPWYLALPGKTNHPISDPKPLKENPLHLLTCGQRLEGICEALLITEMTN
jgi:hypothetical protein